MAPTIMVARVALLAPDTTHPSGSAMPQLSVLQFRGSSVITGQDRRQDESAVTVDLQRGSSVEVETKIA